MLARWSAPARRSLPTRIGLGLALAALAILGLGGVVMAWDGGWFVLRTTLTGTPTFMHGRVIGWVTQAPAVVAAVSGDPWVVGVAMGLGCAAVTGVALVASWRVIRPDRTWLIAFPMLGIGLGLMPGQAILISEAVMVAALAWPLVLVAALGRVGRHRVVVAALTVAIALAHPFAIPVLVIVAAIGALAAARAGPDDEREATRRYAVIALVVAGLLVVRYLVFASPYETEALSLDRLLTQARGSLLGRPLVAVIAAIGLAAWLVARPRLDRLGAVVVVGTLGVVAWAMLGWAADLGRWDQALMYRTFALAVQLPIFGLAVLAARAPVPERPLSDLIVPGVGLVMVAVATTQVLAWQGGLERLRKDLAGLPDGCLDQRAVIERPSVLDHWGVTSLVLILEADAPRHLVIDGAVCAAPEVAAGIPIKAVEGVVVDRAALDGPLEWGRLVPALGGAAPD